MVKMAMIVTPQKSPPDKAYREVFGLGFILVVALLLLVGFSSFHQESREWIVGKSF